MAPPQFPAGPFTPPATTADADRHAWIAGLAALPTQLRAAVGGLTDARLDTPYRAWTARQIVHHVADSHLNSYVRFKWALTEDTPTIKAYDEGAWSGLEDARVGGVEPSLRLLEGLHARWCRLLEAMPPEQFERAFVHPESGDTLRLGEALAYYAWHGRHHTGQVLWLWENTRP